MNEESYWFDAAPLLVEHEPLARPALAELRDSWSRDRSIKGRISSLRGADAKGLLKDALIPDRRNRIEEFAQANGLEYVRWQKKTTAELRTNRPGQYRPGLLMSGDGTDLVSWPGWPFVEFGNLRLSGGLKWGYVALRHDLALPHVVVDTRANDAPPKRGRPAVTSLTRREGPDRGRRSPMDQLKDKVERLDLADDAARNFTAWAEIGREDEARRLLAEGGFQTASEASAAFDVEITNSWVFLYGYELDVSTTEPDLWAWIFALTSRWIDFLDSHRDLPSQRPPFYTQEAVARPSSLAELPRVGGHLGGDGLWGELYG